MRVGVVKPYVDNNRLETTIRDDRSLQREERFLMLVLKSFRNKFTLECNPPVSELEAALDRSYRMIHRNVLRLEERDYLVSVRRGYDNPNQFYFMEDFNEAFLAYWCPEFKGDRGSLLRANRKRFALKKACVDIIEESGGHVISNITCKRKDNPRHENYRCPHCHPPTKKDKTIMTCHDGEEGVKREFGGESLISGDRAVHPTRPDILAGFPLGYLSGALAEGGAVYLNLEKFEALVAKGGTK